MSEARSGKEYNKQACEDSEFPILCQTCLGDNPYLKDKYGHECQVCSRPYTSFRWCPGKRMRYKKTEVCQICAKLKNVCQTCLLDLDYGLPVEARDKVLSIKDDLPRDESNREYYRQMIERDVSNKDPVAVVGGMIGNARKDNEILRRMARNAPYYDRNRPHLCSFWQKGECKRGDECPYRHEMPSEFDRPSSQKNIRDRYYGVNDPVANKLLSKLSEFPKVEPPANKSVTTLCIFDVNVFVKEADIYQHFYQYGHITKVFIVQKSKYAFVTFSTRKEAETAMEGSFNNLIINSQKLRIAWAKNQGITDSLTSKNSNIPSDPNFPLPQNILDENGSKTSSVLNDKTDIQPNYPSQDPLQMGSITK